MNNYIYSTNGRDILDNNADDSEILMYELNNAIVNIYKLILEDMGYDLGYKKNQISYFNYLENDPLDFSENYLEGDDSEIGPIGDIDFSNYKGGVIDINKLISLYPKGNKNYIAGAVMALDKYGDKIGLTPKGKLMVLGQFAHESGGFRYAYELSKGKDKPYGRPVPPYNKIYYGRGPIQVTWAENYKKISQNIFPSLGIHVDIFKDPDICCTNIEIGCAASLAWFMLPGNGKAIQFANGCNIKGLTKKINGGYTGLQDRINHTQKIFEAAK